ncbi:MAG: FAD-linked oxidase C-terminal domain-containing protein, partial [bacterium]
GSTVRHGGRVHKNTVGYDLCRLLVGTEGTIAIITEVTLKLIPRPRVLVDLLVPFDRMSQGLELVARVLSDQRLTPACVEFIERKGIRACNQVLKSNLPFPDAEVQLLIELDGNSLARVTEDAVSIGELAMSLGAREPLVADNPTDSERIWHARRELHNVLKEAYAGLATEDIIVPLSAVPETIEYLVVLEKKFGVPIVPWGHIGDGNIHVGFCRDCAVDRSSFLDAKRAIVSELADFILARGGQISAEHGIGSTKKWLMPRAVGPSELALMRKLKSTLDPDGILNPGKILP